MFCVFGTAKCLCLNTCKLPFLACQKFVFLAQPNCFYGQACKKYLFLALPRNMFQVGKTCRFWPTKCLCLFPGVPPIMLFILSMYFGRLLMIVLSPRWCALNCLSAGETCCQETKLKRAFVKPGLHGSTRRTFPHRNFQKPCTDLETTPYCHTSKTLLNRIFRVWLRGFWLIFETDGES